MKRLFHVSVLLILIATTVSAHEWTLQECINHALQYNTDLRKTVISKLSSQEDVLQSKADLLPSLTATTSQNVTYRPWTQSGSSTVANGYAVSSVDKVYYNGSYGINANWTLWNGNKNRNTVKLNKLKEQAAELDSAETANMLQEQIAQLYVQILYSKEAIKVTRESLTKSQKNEERGKTMYEVGSMSKADLAQLTSQRAEDEYNVVAAESNLRNYKRQLKEILQITDNEPFDVADLAASDEMALRAIPNMETVYSEALATRPEIKSTQLAIDISNMNVKIAKAGRMPTIGLNASAITNTTSMNSEAWGNQMKNNFNLGAGLSVSIPILDNRSTKTAVRKAMLQKQDYLLDMEKQRTSLYSDIENFWINATNNQNKFKAAKVSTQSYKESYDLLSEQFDLGLKNIVELMTGKYNLLNAQQNELQSKYLTIYNIYMLEFYRNGELEIKN